MKSSDVLELLNPEYEHKGSIGEVMDVSIPLTKMQMQKRIGEAINTTIVVIAALADEEETELEREFRILDEACDFWKQTAIDLGYKED